MRASHKGLRRSCRRSNRRRVRPRKRPRPTSATDACVCSSGMLQRVHPSASQTSAVADAALRLAALRKGALCRSLGAWSCRSVSTCRCHRQVLGTPYVRCVDPIFKRTFVMPLCLRQVRQKLPESGHQNDCGPVHDIHDDNAPSIDFPVTVTLSAHSASEPGLDATATWNSTRGVGRHKKYGRRAPVPLHYHKSYRFYLTEMC